MTQQEKVVKQYMKRIGKLLLGSYAEKKIFLEAYENTVYDTLEEIGPIYDLEQLEMRFGFPATIAENHAMTIDAEAFLEQERRRKCIIAIICFCVVLFAIMMTIFWLQDSQICFFGHQIDRATKYF